MRGALEAFPSEAARVLTCAPCAGGARIRATRVLPSLESPFVRFAKLGDGFTAHDGGDIRLEAVHLRFMGFGVFRGHGGWTLRSDRNGDRRGGPKVAEQNSTRWRRDLPDTAAGSRLLDPISVK